MGKGKHLYLNCESLRTQVKNPSLLPWVPGVLFACESLAIEGQSLQNPT